MFFRLEHQKLHEQHKGHDKMHAEMVLILIMTLVVAQFVLLEWKRRHYRSYFVSYQFILAVLTDRIKILVGHSNWNVGVSLYLMFKKSLVAFYIHLATFYMHI